MVWPFLKGDIVSTPDAKEHWEQHYGERDRVWSGRVNVRLAEVVPGLPIGRALDLGCGEGADSVWLADRGWHVVAVDISDTALQRARSAAEARGVLDRIDFQQHDLSETFPDGEFDLVSAHFFHSTLPLDRTRVFVRAAEALKPGGTLLIVDHSEPPPGDSKLDHHRHMFLSPEEVVAALSLPEAEWEPPQTKVVEREVTWPDREPFIWHDNVIVLRRRSSA
ncbi:class I SAM-dependent methyltransferase [Mycobacterium neglectum]|uniref:class I SAM-dependent methyltransferase n=1 Tax=Mycobacterium neglectum TaxID=242737 RepID=UPI000BFED29C|nr:class I SAM-dependent methyltransferase [Mycobacterium neglectum]